MSRLHLAKVATEVKPAEFLLSNFGHCALNSECFGQAFVLSYDKGCVEGDGLQEMWAYCAPIVHSITNKEFFFWLKPN